MSNRDIISKLSFVNVHKRTQTLSPSNSVTNVDTQDFGLKNKDEEWSTNWNFFGKM